MNANWYTCSLRGSVYCVYLRTLEMIRYFYPELGLRGRGVDDLVTARIVFPK